MTQAAPLHNLPPVQLFRGVTVHERSLPFIHRFSYKIALMALDIDRLEAASKTSALFSVGRPNLFSFSPKDHGDGTARCGADLRQWAEAAWAEAGLKIEATRLHLISFPRHLFYKFAPISLWISYNAGGAPNGILYEVHNTFAERHSYAAEIPPETAGRARHQSPKAFHVSPFFDISGKYRFTLRHGADHTHLGLIIESRSDKGRTHLATIKARAEPLTNGALVKLAVRQPFSSLGVSAGIHWQALKLWLKGARYHKKPSPPETRITLASNIINETKPTESTADARRYG